MKYQAYSEYKESGVEWLGKLPKHWECVRLKYVAELEGEKIDPGSQQQYVGMENIESGNGKYITKEDTNPEGLSTSFLEGDVLFGKLRPYLAKSWLANFSGICSSEFLVLRSRKVNSKFLNYYTLTDEFINQVDSSTYGSKMPRASWDFISLMGVPVPEYEDSQKIAHFLDHETAKIDTLIEKQQQLIKLLKEKRQAVISHAVTKGLNPNAPMRDSGVEWLGEVPEHWINIKLKHITNEIIDTEHKTAEYFDDGKFLVCRTTNVRDGVLHLEGGKYTNLDTYNEWTKRGVPEIGDILFTREAPAGEACIVTGEVTLCLGQRMVLFKLKKNRIESEFALHSIYSGLADDFVKQLSQGSTVAHFNMADIQNIPLFEPPLEEQNEIIVYLTKILSKYDGLIRSASRAINLMQERRTALISAAVTGKIDVRNWQSSQQDKNKETAA